MKALVVRQPWASAIVEGIKDVENREWTTGHRGIIAVVAGKSPEAMEDGLEFFAVNKIAPPSETPLGCIVGTVILKDVLTMRALTSSKKFSGCAFAQGPFCWVLRDPLKFAEPLFGNYGARGLYDLTPETEASVWSAVKRA